MTQINLPNLSVTGANLWSQVEDNDKAIRDVVNGNLDASNLADDAVTAAKLRDDASTDANRAVTTNHIRDAAITAAKIADDAVTGDKIANATTATITNSSGVNGTITARKYADGLVLIEGSPTKATGDWSRSSANAFTLGTVPAGFRPNAAIATIRPSISNTGGGGFGFNFVSVGTNGDINLWITSPFTDLVTLVYLGGITYQVA